VLNPLDVWGLGYARLNLASDEREQLLELYYNMHLSDKFRLSFHLQHATDTDATGAKQAYLVPGVRLQAGL
jgi:hypothetical protein